MSSEPAGDHGSEGGSPLIRILLVACAAAASWLGERGSVPHAGLLALVAAAAGGMPVYREALAAVRARRMTMELSMSIAVGAALVIGEFFTAAIIVLFVLVAEELEGLTVERGRRAIRSLVDLLPRQVLVRRESGEQQLNSADLVPGDVVVVKPGGRLPVDGEVVSGQSSVDQSSITGESMPAEKGPGSTAFAGTINLTGVLHIRTGRVGADTAFGKIVAAVERAERTRAPIQKIADRLAGYLVYVALACAALTFVITRDPRATIAVVIVAGACGIAAGTPLAILGAIGRAARAGVIVKGGLYMESLGRVDTVVLDKTGTLTFGVLEVKEVRPAPRVLPRDLLEAAATVEHRSEHPAAKAILRRAAADSISPREPEAFDSTPGLGVVCTVEGTRIAAGKRAFLAARGVDLARLGPAPADLSEVVVARDGVLLGSLHVADVLRPEAVAAVRALRDMGLRTVLLTGDSTAIASVAAGQLGVEEFQAELLPEDKQRRILALRSQGRMVAMVGDGVNDAPALTEAQVGIAVGSGTDVALESADAVILGSDLLKLAEILGIARRCRRIILQNFVGTLAVDGLGVVLAACGVLSPVSAAFVHVASELTFILNSARLVPMGPAPRPSLKTVPSQAAIPAGASV